MVKAWPNAHYLVHLALMGPYPFKPSRFFTVCSYFNKKKIIMKNGKFATRGTFL